MYRTMILLFMLPLTLHSQTTELSYRLITGRFNFGGKSAANSTSIIFIDNDIDRYMVSMPFGRKNKQIYGVSVGLKNVYSTNMILGIFSSMEVQRNEINISDLEIWQESINTSGRLVTTYYNSNFYSYIGFRHRHKSWNFDFVLGPEIGIPIRVKENLEFIGPTESEISTSNYTGKKVDVRLRPEVTLYRGSFGAHLGFSYGISNHSTSEDNARYANARIMRFGIDYRFLLNSQPRKLLLRKSTGSRRRG